jgi:hypothetical protein
MEPLIQASDVAHIMQHWLVYINYNEQLFKELYLAYKPGRGENGCNGERWFYDNYIIPLAEKLRQCGAFGVSSDTLLDYATNRKEWELNGGEHLVKQWISNTRLD